MPEPPAGLAPAAGLAGAVLPQIPALLFSLASCPIVGPGPVGVVFLIPTLAWDHRAPNASPPDAGFEAAEGTGFRPADPRPVLVGWGDARDTEEK